MASLAARLERNLALNGCDGVRICRLALGDRPDTLLPLASDRGFGDAYRYLRPDTGSNGNQQRRGGPVTTLDAWAAANGVAGFDFLKVDIEGGEYRMFLGAREFLASNPNVIIMFERETHGARGPGAARATCSTCSARSGSPVLLGRPFPPLGR